MGSGRSQGMVGQVQNVTDRQSRLRLEGMPVLPGRGEKDGPINETRTEWLKGGRKTRQGGTKE